MDLLAAGRLPSLPAAFLAGRDRELLAPLTWLAAGERPPAPPAPPARRRLAAALAAANTAYGHPAAEELAGKLAEPATRVVVTGQQPGLFGGPLYTLSKAVAAARWAAELEAGGSPAVALFWVASEDHDFDEAANAVVPGRGGPRRRGLGEDPQPLAPLGSRTLGPAVEELLRELIEEAGANPAAAAFWRQVGRWYRPDARFGEAFCRLLTHLLGQRCPLLLDALLPQLKAAQQPHLEQLVRRRHELGQALARADAAIEERGHALKVRPQPGLSPLFLLHRGKRRRIEWRGEDRWRLRGDEATGGTVEELLAILADNPSVIGPGVLARSAVQDAVLGTALQVLGPGEVSYLPQVAPVYRLLEVPAPAITLRPQVLAADSGQRARLGQVGLGLEDLLADGEQLDRLLAERWATDPLTPVRRRIEQELAGLRGPALAIDPNLERPWEKTAGQVARALDAFAGKLTAAAARRDQVARGRVDRLRQDFLPWGQLQERTISTSWFAARYGERFVDALYEQLDLDPRWLRVVEV